jgi:protein TonB
VSAVALARTEDIPAATPCVVRYPVPAGRTIDDSRILIKRAAAVSAALHALLIVVGVIISHWRGSGLTGVPQDEIINVSVISLSALETMLPKGAAPTEPKQLEKPQDAPPQQPAKPKSSEEKKIVARKTLAPPQAQSSQSSESGKQPQTSASAAQADQPLGVANGQAIALEQARISYQDMVATLLARAKRYPERALKRHMTGEGTIRIEITSDGSLAGFEITRSTELPILDEELRAMVERASPFPRFPADLQKNSLALVVPVAFKIDG